MALLAPVATASPLGEADDAITAAWKDAGGRKFGSRRQAG